MNTYGQKNCGTVTYQETLQKGSIEETRDAFEDWMYNKLTESRKSPLQAANARTQQVITIPVVVHIIHNGETIGSGSNIDESRIIEQIERLNKDFRRLNSDTSNTPVEYLNIATDTEIQFVLAKRDPYGLPTEGINRVTGSRPVYDLVHNTELKALSYWPAEDYMNLWVAELENLLGYAQFPVSSLGGLEIASENRLTDGVVIDTDFFGINQALNPESIGRTCTHEVGHFLGLRHTWGDGGCSVDDFCEDTPRSDNSNFGCPDTESCGSKDMVQNYMDLSDDLCMNLFTICQKDRMNVVLGNSPRRTSLVNSSGALPPIMVDNDAGIRELIVPQNGICSEMVSPKAIIQNTGTNTITSFEVELQIDDIPVESRTVSITLQLLETTLVSFSNHEIPDMAKVEIVINQTNGVVDGNPENNQQQVSVSTKGFSSLPISEDFNNFPSNWETRNNDNSLTWDLANAPSETSANTAARVNFYNYENAKGEYDYLISPALDLTTYTGLNLEFDLSYAPFSAGDLDGLIVAISEDCGNTFPNQHYVYFKQGLELATAPVSGGSYVPSGKSDWNTEIINLDQYAGSSPLRIAFIAVNDYGNNLYIDNVNISGTRVPDLDLAVVSVQQPAAVFCAGEVTPAATVQNTGLNTISNFQLTYQLESGETGVSDYTGPPLSTGDQATVQFNPISINSGPGKIVVNIEQVEGQGSDGLSSNNLIEIPYLVNEDRDLIPKIETFSQSLEQSDWSYLNPDNEITWLVSPVTGVEETQNQAAFINFFGYPQTGAIDYLASPVLDFTGTVTPAMTFNVAYAGSSNFEDGLIILASSDCGINYSDTIFQAFGSDLATTFVNGEFFPEDSSDWKLHQIDLSAYAGEPDVRIAFVAINDFGNNLFIDNVQFFVSDRTNSLSFDNNQMVAYPNPTQGDLNISFNLEERSAINLRIVDSMGRVIGAHQLSEVLNQTYEIQLPQPGGIYILQAVGTGFSATRRIIVL
ncbi:MAG: hypothetical protein DHS20C17_14580 [Cyclobacteriaceae bacterium]|nr:MAG: hypothetical protein DHS20C17_14580 [Cyclobacteriaceae bacterium]